VITAPRLLAMSFGETAPVPRPSRHATTPGLLGIIVALRALIAQTIE
jgi:hypothetical protein